MWEDISDESKFDIIVWLIGKMYLLKKKKEETKAQLSIFERNLKSIIRIFMVPIFLPNLHKQYTTLLQQRASNTQGWTKASLVDQRTSTTTRPSGDPGQLATQIAPTAIHVSPPQSPFKPLQWRPQNMHSPITLFIYFIQLLCHP